jgi:prepilin-type N-terminal cleavage/methylation domain-containing protein
MSRPLNPRFSPLPASRRASAFTLIELLIVIAIIAILAGLGFGAVQGALKSAKRAQARNDVNQVAAAVKSYALEYGRLPEAGTEIAALTGENPKGIVFFEAKKAAGDPPKNGLSEDGKLLDPWGNEYEFIPDDDYNNKVEYEGEEFLTTVVVASQGDANFKISNVKDTPKK